MFYKITNFTSIDDFRPEIDADAKDLIERLLKKKPDERIGAHDIEELKSH